MSMGFGITVEAYITYFQCVGIIGYTILTIKSHLHYGISKKGIWDCMDVVFLYDVTVDKFFSI